jgi:vacuolar-type H+-ATPase subunit H
MMDQGGHEPGSMDILYLLERLEEALAGPRIPLTNKTMIDDEECLAIIDQIRLSLPNEIRQARKVNSEREAMLGEAQARADQIIAAADNDARERARDHNIARQAQAQADELLDQAQRQAAQIKQEADDYAYRVLMDLDRRLDGLVTTIRHGLQALRPSNEIDQPGGYSTDTDTFQR